jgi:branched-chain amino acid aminotransferase
MSKQPIDQRDGFIWMDGKLTPWKDAKIHVLTHGLHYASSVFEGQRAYGGNVFKLEEHTKRLRFSANTLGFDLPFTDEEINEACREVIRANKITDGYMRPVAWRGSEQLSVASGNNTIHVAIAAWDWPSYFSPEAKAKGLRLAWSQWKRPSPETEPVHAKAAGLYMICTLAKDKSMADGFDDALMLDYRGYVAECTGANIFFFTRDGELHTPVADCFLNGITRRTAIQIARDMGITVVERHIRPEELSDFKEVFITGSAAEITPIGEIDGIKYTPGNGCFKIMDAYMALVRGEKKAAA